jgi:NAD+ synthase (glutamine-hydrolysing)
MTRHGFVRVAAATPVLRPADCDFNASQMLESMKQAESEGVAVLVFPELSVTGYTCGDLFHTPVLLQGARQALLGLARASGQVFSGVVVLGLPWEVDDKLFNCAAVLFQGKVLGFVPKSYLPNYKEFYEARWFTPAGLFHTTVDFADSPVPFGTDVLFAAPSFEGLRFGIEICEDLWTPNPPSSRQALAGALLLLNLSGSNEVIGKANYRRQLVVNQSGRCLGAYVYCSCGVWESTTDLVFGGHCLIAENGNLIAESPRFNRQAALLLADVDLERLRVERMRTNSFAANGQGNDPFDMVEMPSIPEPKVTFVGGLRRNVEAHPFVPQGEDQLRERCDEIFHAQVAGLARRLESIGKPSVAIGISGGLDSTLALLVACKTFDALETPRTKIKALTMPGFGTTGRTRDNAMALMRQLKVSIQEIDIRPLCLAEMRALGHKPFGIALEGLTVNDLTDRLRRMAAECKDDLVFENVQARMRTSLLMNSGFVVGTGDLSELALGWCTYNGDHMSMYNPNLSIPKTLVKFLVGWAARNEFDGEARTTLLDIVETLISPELLPTDEGGKAAQDTEGAIGPYELHDFFLYHFLRYGAPPEKILFLAGQTQFDRVYSEQEIKRWLKLFFQRFFANQFKRSCLPDGPKVGTISLSPRGDWRMPSDARATLWLKSL